MKIATLWEEDGPERWTLRNALKYKANRTDSQIEELLMSADLSDRLEIAMELELEFGIEVLEEELRNTSMDVFSDDFAS
jgi:acyl carrier protein